MVQTIPGPYLKGEIDVLINLNEAHDTLKIATLSSLLDVSSASMTIPPPPTGRGYATLRDGPPLHSIPRMECASIYAMV